jgi:hypothetical protein
LRWQRRETDDGLISQSTTGSGMTGWVGDPNTGPGPIGFLTSPAPPWVVPSRWFSRPGRPLRRNPLCSGKRATLTSWLRRYARDKRAALPPPLSIPNPAKAKFALSCTELQAEAKACGGARPPPRTSVRCHMPAFLVLRAPGAPQLRWSLVADRQPAIDRTAHSLSNEQRSSKGRDWPNEEIRQGEGRSNSAEVQG